MADLPKALILDTNVLLDMYLSDRYGHADARQAIDLAQACGVPLLYTAGQAKDVFFLAGQTLKRTAREELGALSHETAKAINAACWAILENLDEMATVVGADASDVWLARKYRSIHADFEDNLIIAAAERAQASFIVTNDETLMKHAPVATISPERLVALLEAFEDDD